MKLSIILGSTRDGRNGKRVADWVYNQIKGDGNWQVQLLDIKDFALPIFSDEVLPSMMAGNYSNQAVIDWSRKIAESDAFIFVSPEYNHGMPSSLKNAIDWLYPEWGNKPAGIVAYSTGIGGGIRSAEQLRLVLIHLAVANVQSVVTIPYVKDAFDEGGEVIEEKFRSMLHGQSLQLYNWSRVLKMLRDEFKVKQS